MINKLKSLLILGLFCLIGTTVFAADRFKLIKNKINASVIFRFDVLITIESKIFDDIDSLSGQIILAEDGRYRAELGGDIYLNDGKTNWEYSDENSQATKRELGEGEKPDNRLSFFRDLDSFYKTSIIKQDLIYKLIKIDSTAEALPDSMTIFLDKDRPQISKIEYFDLNDDLNCIYLTEEFYEDDINENQFKLNLPDSVEIISIP